MLALYNFLTRKKVHFDVPGLVLMNEYDMKKEKGEVDLRLEQLGNGMSRVVYEGVEKNDVDLEFPTSKIVKGIDVIIEKALRKKMVTIMLFGPSGTGKTVKARQIINAGIENKFKVVGITAYYGYVVMEEDGVKIANLEMERSEYEYHKSQEYDYMVRKRDEDKERLKFLKMSFLKMSAQEKLNNAEREYYNAKEVSSTRQEEYERAIGEKNRLQYELQQAGDMVTEKRTLNAVGREDVEALRIAKERVNTLKEELEKAKKEENEKENASKEASRELRVKGFMLNKAKQAKHMAEKNATIHLSREEKLQQAEKELADYLTSNKNWATEMFELFENNKSDFFSYANEITLDEESSKTVDELLNLWNRVTKARDDVATADSIADYFHQRRKDETVKAVQRAKEARDAPQQAAIKAVQEDKAQEAALSKDRPPYAVTIQRDGTPHVPDGKPLVTLVDRLKEQDSGEEWTEAIDAAARQLGGMRETLLNKNSSRWVVVIDMVHEQSGNKLRIVDTTGIESADVILKMKDPGNDEEELVAPRDEEELVAPQDAWDPDEINKWLNKRDGRGKKKMETPKTVDIQRMRLANIIRTTMLLWRDLARRNYIHPEVSHEKSKLSKLARKISVANEQEVIEEYEERKRIMKVYVGSLDDKIQRYILNLADIRFRSTAATPALSPMEQATTTNTPKTRKRQNLVDEFYHVLGPRGMDEELGRALKEFLQEFDDSTDLHVALHDSQTYVRRVRDEMHEIIKSAKARGFTLKNFKLHPPLPNTGTEGLGTGLPFSKSHQVFQVHAREGVLSGRSLANALGDLGIDISYNIFNETGSLNEDQFEDLLLIFERYYTSKIDEYIDDALQDEDDANRYERDDGGGGIDGFGAHGGVIAKTIEDLHTVIRTHFDIPNTHISDEEISDIWETLKGPEGQISADTFDKYINTGSVPKSQPRTSDASSCDTARTTALRSTQTADGYMYLMETLGECRYIQLLLARLALVLYKMKGRRRDPDYDVDSSSVATDVHTKQVTLHVYMLALFGKLPEDTKEELPQGVQKRYGYISTRRHLFPYRKTEITRFLHNDMNKHKRYMEADDEVLKHVFPITEHLKDDDVEVGFVLPTRAKSAKKAEVFIDATSHVYDIMVEDFKHLIERRDE